MSNLYLII